MSAGWDPNASHPQPPQQYGPIEMARSRCGPPGILLIVTGVLNLLLALAGLGFVAYQMSLSPEKYAEIMRPTAELMDKFSPGMGAKLLTEEARFQSTVQNSIGNGVSAALSFLIILGGWWMRDLKGYGLAMAAGVTALLPCATTTGCCLLGQAAGIWAVLVLMNAEVKMAFDMAAHPQGVPYPPQQYPGEQPYRGPQEPGTYDPNQPRPGDGPR